MLPPDPASPPRAAGIGAGTRSAREAAHGSSASVARALRSARAKCSLSLLLIPSNPHIYPSSYLVWASRETPVLGKPALHGAFPGCSRGLSMALCQP